MKKKCRVYKQMPTAQAGGAPVRQPSQTQDSKKDPVFEDKSNNFMSWLHKSNEESRVEAMIKADMEKLESGEYQIGGNVYEDSGYGSGDYGQNRKRDLGHFNAAMANMPGIGESIGTTLTGLDAMGAFDGMGKQRKADTANQTYVENEVANAPPTKPVFNDDPRPNVVTPLESAFPEQGVPVDPKPKQPSWYNGFAREGIEIDRTNSINSNITPGIQAPNKIDLATNTRDTTLRGKYDYLSKDNYTPVYTDDKKRVVYGENHPVGNRKQELNNRQTEIRRKMGSIYGLPMNAQGNPDYTQMDPNIILDKSKMDPAMLSEFYDNLDEKDAIRDAEGFQRKQYYGDTEAIEKGYSSATDKRDLNLGIRFATGVQSGQLNSLAEKKKFEASGGDQLGTLERGGDIMYAQKGISYPGQLPLMPESPDDTQWADNKHNPYATSAEAFEEFADEESTDPWEDYAPAPNAGNFEPKRERNGMNLFGNADNKSRAQNQVEAMGAITTMKGVTGFGNIGEREKLQKQRNNKISNVFETHGTMGDDRGDYLANVPGIGGNFRPDELTRMGYNTKIAQEGGGLSPESSAAGTDAMLRLDHYSIRGQGNKEASDAYTQQLTNLYDDPDYNISAGMDSLNTVYPTVNKDFQSQPWGDVITPEERAKNYNKDLIYKQPNLSGVGLEWLKKNPSDNPKDRINPYYKQQEGGEYNMDDEVELSEAEINNLIAQGYNLEYLD